MNRLLHPALVIGIFHLVSLNVTSGEEAPFDYAKEGRHWSFQAPLRYPAPLNASSGWERNRIDAFVYHRMKEAGLEPSQPAERLAIMRRLSFDLTGLPPLADDLEAGRSIEEHVEWLLSSPAFGERWARLWLDVARFAEDQAHIVGNNKSLTYPNAFLYRDWVVSAFNQDIPYDQFLRLQLAADLMDESGDPNGEERAALGFMGLGPKYYRRKDVAVMADEWEDRIDTLCRGVLALTVACARCHDHFYDPIPTSDYYALAGVFASTDMFNSPIAEDCEMTGDGQTKNPDDAAHIVREASAMRDVQVFERGNSARPGETVSRGFLTILGGGKRQEFSRENSGRLDLANAMVSRENPLTSRVWVNRVWSELIGQPLVATTSNFGKLGDKPTHPELLDDLAVRFMEEGNWSLKWLVREIVLSATYLQSTVTTEKKDQVDPANRMLSRMNRRRLSVEMWRDALFMASGQLDRQIGGRSFAMSDPDGRRRGLYSEVSRLQLDPMQALFDFPDPNLHSAGRIETTTPLQKLFVMNHPLVVTQGEAAARRVEEMARETQQGTVGHSTGSAPDSETLVRTSYRLLFNRYPSSREMDLGVTYLGEADLRDYVQALLVSNEFSWVD